MTALSHDNKLTVMIQDSGNIFNHLSAFEPPKPSDQQLELNCYLTSDIEDVVDALEWWYKEHTTFPQLSQMALDYLSIPGKFHAVLLTSTI